MNLKRLLALALAVVMLLSLCACGKNKKDDKKKKKSDKDILFNEALNIAVDLQVLQPKAKR